MLLEVILCRKEGRRLRKGYWPAPILGRLVVRDNAGETNNFKRNVRSAELEVTKDALGNAEINAVPPLSEPELIPSPDGALLLRGIELDARDGEIYEHEQVWLCRAK